MKRLTKALKHDLKVGVLGQLIKFIPIILFCLFVCVAFLRAALEWTRQVPTFADYCLYLFKGMEPYDPNSNEPFRVPFIWLFFNLYIAYLIGNYPQEDLSGSGVYLLMHLQSRKCWWLSKCLWNLIIVGVCYFLIFFFVFVLSACTGGLSMVADHELQLVLSGLNIQVFEQNSWIYYVFVLPTVTSMAVSVFQMVLSFWIKPVISYICILVMYVFSAYYIWFPFGNYSMLLRSLPVLGDTGYTVFSAVLLDTVLLALSVSFGLIYFKKYTILGKVQGVT